MMEALRTSETSVNTNLTTRRYIPEDSKLHMADPPSRQSGRHMTAHCNTQTYDLKSGHESQKGTRHQDRLADGPSLAK
jgi:hypothetical protein